MLSSCIQVSLSDLPIFLHLSTKTMLLPYL